MSDKVFNGIVSPMLASFLSDAKLFLSLLGFSLIISVADAHSLLNFPESWLQNVSVPIQMGLYKTSLAVGQQFEFVILARRAAQENKAMTEQLATILSENAGLRRQLAEAQGFLDQQGSLDPLTYTTVAARPISRSRYLIIDRGSNAGLKVGQPAVYKDNLLGQIVEVSPSTARVMLVSDPDSKIAAFISSQKSKSKGILLGQFGSDMLMDEILHQESIEPGDLVYSEGTEDKFPRGLVLGQVSEVMDRSNELFKQAKVKPMFDVGNLDIVFVITN